MTWLSNETTNVVSLLMAMSMSLSVSTFVARVTRSTDSAMLPSLVPLGRRPDQRRARAHARAAGLAGTSTKAVDST